MSNTTMSAAANISNILRAGERIEGYAPNTLRFSMALTDQGVELRVYAGDGGVFDENITAPNIKSAEEALGAIWLDEALKRVEAAEAQVDEHRRVAMVLKGRRAPGPDAAKPGRKPGVPSLTETRSEVSGADARRAREARGVSREKAGAAMPIAVTGATVMNWEASDKPVPMAYAQFLGLAPATTSEVEVTDEPTVTVIEG